MKKEKVLNIIKICYIITILLVIVSLPLAIFLLPFLYISIALALVAVVLYLIIHIIRIKIYMYKCPKCGKHFAISLLKDMSSYNAASGKKVLTCPHCGIKEVMEQKLK